MNRRIFLIADTHFGHANIIKYENRPFPDPDAMTESLINLWNSVVSKNDDVYLLGDFSMYNKERSTEICRRLNGRKILIMGNHDDKSVQYYLDCGFYMVSKHPVILENYWILSHEPMYVNDNMPYANIYGHVHGSAQYSTYSAQSCCVCVERTGYKPIPFEDIKEKISSLNN